jgi:hypothetical protein
MLVTKFTMVHQTKVVWNKDGGRITLVDISEVS